jgi:lysophospholipase L1-like esterase
MLGFLLGACATLFLLVAIAFNEWLAGVFLSESAKQTGGFAQIRLSQGVFFCCAAALTLLAIAVAKWPRLNRVANRPIAVNSALTIVSLLAPLTLLEFMLRPFAELNAKTSIFERDEALGWKLRPGAEDNWGGVFVRINGKGLRGPELDYDKSEGALRVLCLGDSVTFGYRIEDPLKTYPYLAGPLLEANLGRPVETINAGVGGYSPWQEFLYLQREGIRYRPDLVLVGFVLNDLTEKIQLVRFGGTGEGFQLEHTFKGRFDRWADRIALLHFGNRLYARLRFGSDIQRKAAEIELMDVKALVERPERPEYVQAWSETLESLDLLFAFCRQRNLPAALVIFPYRFQYDNPAKYAGPQERLMRFASERGIPALDLMPGLFDAMQAAGLQRKDIYFDRNHFTEKGHALIAPLVSDFILSNRLLAFPSEATIPGATAD